MNIYAINWDLVIFGAIITLALGIIGLVNLFGYFWDKWKP